jgi:hypothetical protein
VFSWHERPGSVARLIPAWAGIRCLDPRARLALGDRAILEIEEWIGRRRMEIACVEQTLGRSLRLEQTSGPFAAWSLQRELESDGAEGCRIRDRVEVRAGPLGRHRMVSKIRALLRGGYARLEHDLAAHARCGGEPWRILLTGASGLVGSALAPFLTTGGHRVERLVRGAPRAAGEIGWDPLAGTLDRERLEGVDAVVHLAGESVGGGRWSAARKEAIRSSRVRGTRTLCEGLARLRAPPRVLVSASASGFYGNRGEEPLTESSAPGEGFLAEVCGEWEAATLPAEEAGVRVVRLRIGLVLSPEGGALAAMLPAFRLGVGGRVGSGEQFLSWIAIEDLLAVIHQSLIDEQLRGPVNATSPSPIAQGEFARTLARVLRRPALLPVPAFAVRLALGEMGEALLLEGARVLPRKLLDTGFEFSTPDLEPALRLVLGKDFGAAYH